MEERNQKIIVIGENGVGKSTLISKYCLGDCENASKTNLGIRLEKKTEVFEGLKVHQLFWDLPGEMEKGNTPDSFYKSVDGVVLVISLSDPGSYENIHNMLRFVRNKTQNAPLMILANKSDVFESDEINRVLDMLQIEEEELIITSATTGLNVDFALRKMAQNILAATTA